MRILSLETSSNPDTVRGASCFLGTVGSRRAAGTGRVDPQPDTNPSQLWFAVKRAFRQELQGEAKSKKAPVEGGLEVSLKP